MLVDSFANRLEIAMKNRNMKQVELHEKTHISESLISKYLSGKALPRQKKIYSLAQVLEVNEAWLMGYDVSSSPLPSHLKSKDLDKTKNLPLEEKRKKLLDFMNENNIENLFAIPLYNKIEQNLQYSERYIEGYIPLNPSMYNMKNPDDYFYFRMYDDSMDNKYQEGDYILMKKSSNIKNDTIALVILDNTTLIRQITAQGDLLLLEPLSSNTTKYKTQACPKESVKILGTVIGYIGYERSN